LSNTFRLGAGALIVVCDSWPAILIYTPGDRKCAVRVTARLKPELESPARSDRVIWGVLIPFS